MPLAARVGDPHVCPIVTPGTPPVPHTGMPIMPPGHVNTLIGNMPAARVSDMAACVGPPDVIIAGAATVLINHLPAARLLDTTAHGGMISMGEPTVFIDGPQFVCPYAISYDNGGVQFGPKIRVVGSPAFQSAAMSDLVKLSATPSGSALLNSIETSNHSLTLRECGPGSDNANTTGSWSNPNLYNGTGTDAVVSYNPVQTPLYNNGSAWDNPQTAVILGHELTHGSHITHGNLSGDPTSGPTVPHDPTTGYPMTRAEEERRTVGLPADGTHNIPDYTGEPFSENTVRNDLGEPPRTSYNNPTGGTW